MGQQHKTKQAMANELKTGHRRSSPLFGTEVYFD